MLCIHFVHVTYKKVIWKFPTFTSQKSAPVSGPKFFLRTMLSSYFVYVNFLFASDTIMIDKVNLSPLKIETKFFRLFVIFARVEADYLSVTIVLSCND